MAAHKSYVENRESQLSPNRHKFVVGLKLCDEFARAMMPA